MCFWVLLWFSVMCVCGCCVGVAVCFRTCALAPAPTCGLCAAAHTVVGPGFVSTSSAIRRSRFANHRTGNLTGNTENSDTVGAFDKASIVYIICILWGCWSDCGKAVSFRPHIMFLSHIHNVHLSHTHCLSLTHIKCLYLTHTFSFSHIHTWFISHIHIVSLSHTHTVSVSHIHTVYLPYTHFMSATHIPTVYSHKNSTKNAYLNFWSNEFYFVMQKTRGGIASNLQDRFEEKFDGL